MVISAHLDLADTFIALALDSVAFQAAEQQLHFEGHAASTKLG